MIDFSTLSERDRRDVEEINETIAGAIADTLAEIDAERPLEPGSEELSDEHD